MIGNKLKHNTIYNWWREKRKKERVRYKSKKNVQDLYAENCKTIMKEIKEDLNNWKDITCS